MKYYSLNQQSPRVGFREATLRGQAPDKGLYFPETIPQVDKSLLENIESCSEEEIAFRVIRPYVAGEIPDAALQRIVGETVNFPVPLVAVTGDIFSLELYHGPTLAFKDTGARFMSRCLGYFVQSGQVSAGTRSGKIVVLVATSGDTGGAVANGFYGVEGVEVVILYPSGKVSKVQEQQLTTLGKNVHALEVDGTFDDCQRLVKQAFADASLREHCFLTSANSINVARWLPQQFYYFFAWKQWRQSGRGETPPIYCVPSGNFGNICAGILAHLGGLPASHFIAACNANDVVPRFLQTEQYEPRPAVATLSNAMDVGDPSNFIRILELFQHRFPALSQLLSAVSVTDAVTTETLLQVYRQHHYLPDPHGAVGFRALEDYLLAHPGQQGIVLETAHPVKFYDVVEPVTGNPIPLPPAVAAIMNLPKQARSLAANYDELQDFLKKI
ncbi:MAG TPA: threonine synthase [Lacibacter sp.]|nr:threonine synthase [Lacibacter sp.]HMO89777.1 threonine synthase [Lacibacter sp.]HMP88286.1 threonine synthase [Lacibacter sp.]